MSVPPPDPPPADVSSAAAPLPERIAALERELAEGRQQWNADREEQERLRLLLDSIEDYALLTLDREARIVGWSHGAERLFGYEEREIVGQPGSVIFTPEDQAQGVPEQEFATARVEGRMDEERWHQRRDGSRFWGSGVLTSLREPDGTLRGYAKILRNLTAHKQQEEQLRESEERFRLFAENVTDYALFQVDPAGRISSWNAGAERTFGYGETEILGRPLVVLMPPEEAGLVEEDLRTALTQGRAEYARWMVCRDSRRFWARWVTTPMRDRAGTLRGFAKVLRDETERKELADQLQHSLHEKELLLREIHHRVKNNLQVISSLLSLEASQIDDGKMQRILEELQDRVHTIATLHQTLYGSRDLAHIQFGPYMEEIVRHLLGFSAVDRERIEVRLEADDVALPLEQALPLGLVVNELFSNALKHAFPGSRRGVIQVQFRYLPETVPAGETMDWAWCELVVEDNGVGLRNPEELWQGTSMGLRIVRSFSSQLQGRVALNQGNSTRFVVRFPLEPSPVVS